MRQVSVPYEITLLSNGVSVPLSGTTFQYLMKLHYSQTFRAALVEVLRVSVPYEITLLSNPKMVRLFVFLVSVPYEITLLSNDPERAEVFTVVSVPYEITLLSNLYSI